MSRPFSYNDENFTVIGNLLFVHFIDSAARDSYQPAIPVPNEIYKRLYSYGNLAIVMTYYNGMNSYMVPIYISNSSGKPYITFCSNTSAVNYKRYHYCFYLLKDI